MSWMKDIQKQRNTDFHHIKGKRIKDEKDRKLFKDMIVEQNRKKHDIVVQEEWRIARSLNRYEKSKVRRNKQDYSMKVEKQQSEISELDQGINKMEKIEKEMLDRLKNSQQLEQEAYKHLEEAIHSSEKSY